MRNLVIGLGGTRVNASRPRARREGVHTGLIPGQHGRESAGGSLSSVWTTQVLKAGDQAAGWRGVRRSVWTTQMLKAGDQAAGWRV